MSRYSEFRGRVLSGEVMSGTFVKTPAIEVVELLAVSGLDFICLDAEHSPFDRARLDACLAIARAMDTRCCIPRESVPTGLLVRWSRPIVSSNSAARALALRTP